MSKKGANAMIYIFNDKRSKVARARIKWVVAFVFVIAIASSAVFALTGNNGRGEYYNRYDDLYTYITMYKGQYINEPAQPELAGHRFLHWSLSPEGGGFDFAQPVHEDMALYAIWQPYDEYTYDSAYDVPHIYDYYYDTSTHDYHYCNYQCDHNHLGYEYPQYTAHPYEEESIANLYPITIRFLWNRDGLEPEVPYSYPYQHPYIGSAPYYVPFVPFEETPPFDITFIFNDGVTPSVTLQTDSSGHLCCCDGWPVTPVHPDGLHFMMWTNTPTASGGTWTAWPGIRFREDTNVYFQWGHHVWFRHGGDQYGWYEYEYMLPGHSFTSFAAYTQENLEFPVPWLDTGYRFMGWYTRNPDGSFNEPFTSNSVVNEDMWVYPRIEQVDGIVVVFDPANSTPHAEFEVRTVGPSGTVGAGNMPDDPTRDGRIFLGWSYCCCRNVFDYDRVVEDWESPLTVTAIWGVLFTFNCNYIVLPSGDDYYGFDPRIIVPRQYSQPLAVWPYAYPVRVGYIFMGWYTKTSAGEYDRQVWGFWDAYDRNMDVYARWEAAHSVIFNPNGGTTPEGHGARFAERDGTIADMPDAPHRDDHTFIGWTRTQDGLPTQEMSIWDIYFWGSVDTYYDDNPLVLYAQWAHGVNFLCMHPDRLPSWWEPESMLVHAGRSAAQTAELEWFGQWIQWPIPTNDNLPGPQWRFKGWFTSADVNNPGTEVTRYCAINGETSLYAHWEERTHHTVTFYLDGGTLGDHLGNHNPPGTHQSQYRQAWDGESVRWSSRPVGANFGGGGGLNQDISWRYSAPEVRRTISENRDIHVESWWLTDEDTGERTWWAPAGHQSVLTDMWTGRLPFGGASTPVTSDITVTPEWVFRVTFHPNGGHTAVIGDGFWVPGAAGMGEGLGSSHYHVRHIPVGPNFEGGTINDDGFLRTISNVFAFCPIEQQHIIVTPINTPVVLGMPRDGIMTRPDHVFVGWWSMRMDPSVEFGDEPPGAEPIDGTELIDRDTRIYARWLYVPADRVVVEFDPNGGSWWSGTPLTGVRPTPPFHQGTAIGVSRMPQFPIRDGYIFMGWYRTPQPPGSRPNVHQRVHSSTVIHENTTVYAHWEPYVLVTFEPNGGTHPQGVPVRKVAQGRNFAAMNTIWSQHWEVSGNLAPPSMQFTGGMYSVIGPFNGQSPAPQWLDNGVETNFVFHHPWNYESDASGDVLTASTVITRDMTFYAQWVTRVTFNSNLETFIPFGGCFQRHGYVPRGFTFGTARSHPHATVENTTMHMLGIIPTGTGADPYFWNALTHPLAAHVNFNDMRDGSGAVFDANTVVNAPMDVYGMWTTNVIFMENGAPAGSILPGNRERSIVLPEPNNNLANSVCPHNPAQYYGMPQPPVWPGFTFSHWNDDPANTGRTVGPTDEISRPTALFAIWRAILTFDATGGLTNNSEQSNVPSITVEILRGRFIGPMMPSLTTTNRPGWVFEEWNTHRHGLRDGTGESFDPDLPVMYSQHYYAQWRANVTFNLQGGHMSGNFANVVRHVHEADTIQNSGGMPTPARAGYTFAGWLDSGGNPIPANFATMPWEDGHTTVFASWAPITSYFEFIKSTYVIYDGYDPVALPGAVFRLYRLEAQGDGAGIPDTWQQLGPAVTSQDVPQYGLVRFEGLTFTGTYKLIEESAPRGYNTPDGHWIVRWNRVDPLDHTTWVIGATHHSGNPEFLRLPVGAAPPASRLYVGNMPAQEIEFNFRKTDYQLHTRIAPTAAWDMTHDILLGGAIFELYRYNGDSPPADMLVYSGNIGTNPGQWQLVGPALTSTDDPLDPAMMFSLTVDGVYHLVEVAAPHGFMTPRGQWRIWVNEDEASDFEIRNIGCIMLPIILWNQEDTFYIANILEFELPLSGGVGSSIYYVTGGTIVLMAAVAWMVLYSKKRKQLSTITNYS